MAGLNKEQRADKDEKADDSHLVVVSKAGEELAVHPSCLDDHKHLGWQEV